MESLFSGPRGSRRRRPDFAFPAEVYSHLPDAKHARPTLRSSFPEDMLADKFGVGWMVLVADLVPASAVAGAYMTSAGGVDFAIFRILDPPRERVWQALTDPERLKE
jgi:hypothetical protein